MCYYQSLLLVNKKPADIVQILEQPSASQGMSEEYETLRARVCLDAARESIRLIRHVPAGLANFWRQVYPSTNTTATVANLTTYAGASHHTLRVPPRLCFSPSCNPVQEICFWTITVSCVLRASSSENMLTGVLARAVDLRDLCLRIAPR